MKYHFFSLEYAGELRIFYKEGKIVSVKHASPNSQVLKERPGTTLHPKGYSSQKTDEVSFMSLCCMQLLSMKESARIKQEEVSEADRIGDHCLSRAGSQAGACRHPAKDRGGLPLQEGDR